MPQLNRTVNMWSVAKKKVDDNRQRGVCLSVGRVLSCVGMRRDGDVRREKTRGGESIDRWKLKLDASLAPRRIGERAPSLP